MPVSTPPVNEWFGYAHVGTDKPYPQIGTRGFCLVCQPMLAMPTVR